MFLRLYLFIAPNLLLGVCLFRVMRTPARTRHPIFALYLTVELIQFLVIGFLNLLLAYHLASRNAYQWTAVGETGVTSLLELAVLYELANELVLSRAPLRAAFLSVLQWSTAIIVLTAAITAALLNQTGVRRVVAAFETVDFSANLLKIGLLLVLLLFTRALRVVWTGLPAGLALGFAVAAGMEMAAASLWSALGPAYYVRLDILRMFGFHICVLIWLIYIFLPGKPPSFTGHRPDRGELEAWDQELQKIVR